VSLRHVFRRDGLQKPTLSTVDLVDRANRAVPSVEFTDVSLAFDEHVVLHNLSFSVPRGAMRILLGASGTGKTIILKLILGLLRPDAGTVRVNGRRIDDMPEHDLLGVRADIGMMFQENALFDSLTVGENVGYRLYEETEMPQDQVRARVEQVLSFVGLGEYIDRMPATLSGGQRRRVAIARAMAPKPSLILFDDPTTGLDPIIASTIDDEIIKLRDLEHATAIVVTHQIRDAFYISMHEAVRHDSQVQIARLDPTQGARCEYMVLHEGRIHFQGSGTDLLASRDPFLKEFLYRTLPPW
jgi:phospholipid/cholesterol/gamma-HCH transport system ATP-binding protein